MGGEGSTLERGGMPHCWLARRFSASGKDVLTLPVVGVECFAWTDVYFAAYNPQKRGKSSRSSEVLLDVFVEAVDAVHRACNSSEEEKRKSTAQVATLAVTCKKYEVMVGALFNSFRLFPLNIEIVNNN